MHQIHLMCNGLGIMSRLLLIKSPEVLTTNALKEIVIMLCPICGYFFECNDITVSTFNCTYHLFVWEFTWRQKWIVVLLQVVGSSSQRRGYPQWASHCPSLYSSRQSLHLQPEGGCPVTLYLQHLPWRIWTQVSLSSLPYALYALLSSYFNLSKLLRYWTLILSSCGVWFLSSSGLNFVYKTLASRWGRGRCRLMQLMSMSGELRTYHPVT